MNLNYLYLLTVHKWPDTRFWNQVTTSFPTTTETRTLISKQGWRSRRSEDLKQIWYNWKQQSSSYKQSVISVLNTWFSHKSCRRITWYSPDATTKKIYDFILSCSLLRQFVKNCRVDNSYDFDSDHRLVIADMKTPSTKEARFRKRHKEDPIEKARFNSSAKWEHCYSFQRANTE